MSDQYLYCQCVASDFELQTNHFVFVVGWKTNGEQKINEYGRSSTMPMKFVYNCKWWIRRRYRKLIAELDRAGIMRDTDQYSDPGLRQIRSQEEYNLLEDLLWKCAHCSKNELNAYKESDI